MDGIIFSGEINIKKKNRKIKTCIFFQNKNYIQFKIDKYLEG